MIRTEALTKRFENRAVLDALSLSIESGDRIALIGSNGAGKTTLFRCLLGHYTFQGRVVHGEGAARRRDVETLGQVAFVPQLPPPLRMPVGDLMSFAEHGAGADPVRMDEIAGKMGIDLAEIRRRPFYRLSGGQKQKILVTLALARPVDLLVFDEPAANLDPAARAVFIDLLAELRDCSMLIASHRLEEVAPLVNRVIELDRGKIVLDDSVVDRLKAGDFRKCEIGITQPHPSFAAAIADWGFAASEDGISFAGRVPAGETLRFLGLLSRYASLIDSLSFSRDLH